MARARPSGRRGRANPPVLLPAEARPAVPLPAAVPILAALGLAVLCLCTVPAVRTQQRLQHEHAQLQRRAEQAEAEVKRLRRELESGPAQAYLQRKARRELLQRGASYVAERDRRLGRSK